MIQNAVSMNMCSLLVLGVGAAATTSSAHAGNVEYTFIRVIDSSGSGPELNNNGTVAFLNNGQLFTGSGGPLTTVWPGDGQYGPAVGFHGINDIGLVVLSASVGVITQGIYVTDGGSPTPVVHINTQNPGGMFSSVSLPAINADGTVSFHAQLANGGGQGIFSSGGTYTDYTTIADTTGPFVSFNGRTSINDNGVVALRGGTSTTSGVYTGNGGPLTTIADSSGSFHSITGDPSINNSGTVAFEAATLVPGPAVYGGIYTGNGGPLTTIVDAADGPFSQVCCPSINDSGQVTFRGKLADTGKWGIFMGPDTVADKVIQQGDALFESTLLTFAQVIGPHVLNDNGDIVFNYLLANGEFGIAVARAGGTEPMCPGDITGDDTVDVMDLLALLSAWGPNPSHLADLNGDRTIDVQDLLMLLSAWGPCPTSGVLQRD